MRNKRIVFLSGTRADFGKLKSLISISQSSKLLDVHVFVTGMHMNSKYGRTIDEVIKAKIKNIYPYINHEGIDHMDRTLANTINGFSHFISEIQPDLIVVHGDRVEALAGAIVGSLNNILVAHIEGGELSGTIDELIRHAVTKMSHIHFVANQSAKNRLLQLGEKENSIWIIGSPDIDLMDPEKLPCLNRVKKHYDISFDEFSIAMFHPVTTEYAKIKSHSKNFVDALLASEDNFVVIFPNNDLGSDEIINEYKRLKNNPRFRIFPSLRFEYFLTLLKSSNYIVGNSSAGIREAPFYGVPTVDIGTRQRNRADHEDIFHSDYQAIEILKIVSAVKNVNKQNVKKVAFKDFGNGQSDKHFFEILMSNSLWKTSCQKQMQVLDR
ncbi:MAG: UDP-N-acetylglucosamine 2-epimerase [Porticoccaceae bacterium]